MKQLLLIILFTIFSFGIGQPVQLCKLVKEKKASSKKWVELYNKKYEHSIDVYNKDLIVLDDTPYFFESKDAFQSSSGMIISPLKKEENIYLLLTETKSFILECKIMTAKSITETTIPEDSDNNTNVTEQDNSLFSHTGFGAPNCSDSNVKALVIKISTKKLKNELFHTGLMQSSIRIVRGNTTYEYWSQHKDNTKAMKKIIDNVDKQILAAGMTLTGIRTNGKNDEIKKCQCGGELTFANGQTHTIKYTAQYTEDNQIYIEIFGL